MTASLESKAVFKARGLALGLNDTVLDDMDIFGWSTIGSFAFACSYVPGQGDDTVFKADVLIPVLQAANHPLASVLRRFYFECYSMAASEMRSRLDRTSSDPPRVIPQPEREQRFQQLVRLLPGMRCTGVLEPAYSITDKMTQMLEQNQLKYISWTECPTREDELLSVKVDRFWKPDAAGHMKEVIVAQHPNTDTSTDLKLMQALMRRGMAFHMSHLMSFETHEKLRNLLMGELARQPPSSEYGWLSMAQLDRADKEIFRQLSELCRSGLAADSTGIRPLERHMQSCLDSTTVRVMLMHLPALSGVKRQAGEVSSGSVRPPPGEGQSVKAKKKARARERSAATAEVQAPKGASKGATKKGGAKGGGKAKQSEPFIPMPAQLRGMNARTTDGSSICFAFNLQGGCAAAPCPKGKHVCAKCLGAHSLTLCTAP
jgi:hypothetical protein